MSATQDIFVCDGQRKYQAISMKMAAYDVDKIIIALDLPDFKLAPCESSGFGSAWTPLNHSDWLELDRSWSLATYSHRLSVINRLEGITDPLEILRILREINALRAYKIVVRRKHLGGRAAMIRVILTCWRILGVVKILFAPLRINYSSLRPVRIVA
jgi:hypothetical protein